MADLVFGNNQDQPQQKKLFHVRVVRLGIAHFVIGLGTLAVGIMDVSFSSIAFDVFSIGKSVTGIWIGAVILLTGGVAFVSSRSEVRRRAANLTFLILSLLSLLLSIVMIGIAISDIASSEFNEGRIAFQKEVFNVSSCINITTEGVATSSSFRCVPTITFDQKLTAGSLLVAFGYLESLFAFYSLLVALSITRNINSKLSKSLSVQPGREPVAISSISVNAYFEERMRYEEIQSNGPANGNSPAQDNFRMHVSPSQSEFPDSKEFRDHLETLGT